MSLPVNHLTRLGDMRRLSSVSEAKAIRRPFSIIMSGDGALELRLPYWSSSISDRDRAGQRPRVARIISQIRPLPFLPMPVSAKNLLS